MKKLIFTSIIVMILSVFLGVAAYRIGKNTYISGYEAGYAACDIEYEEKVRSFWARQVYGMKGGSNEEDL